MEATKRFLTIIYQETDRLNRLINDLWTFPAWNPGDRIEAGADLPGPAGGRGPADSPEPPHRENLSFSVELGPTAVWADEDRIREVLVNLLDNAVKYTPDGGSIKVSEVDRGDMQEFIICDTGIGIPARVSPAI